MPSLFEEEIVHEEVELNFALEAGAEHFPEALDYFPRFSVIESVLDRYLATVGELKAALDIPVIASLNGATPGGWVNYAQMLSNAGADALELNIYRLATDPDRTAAEVEAGDLELVSEVVAAVDLPVAVKLGPYYTAVANFARRVTAAGAHGLVLFNRFYQPDLDVETRDVVPRIDLSQAVGAAAAAALDRHPPSRSSAPASRWPPPPASTPAPTWPRRCWSGPTWP